MNPNLPEAIASAGRALVARRGQDSLWRDFHTLAGESCEWVTGFVAVAAEHCDELRPVVQESVRALYYRQRRSGGWGYNENVPPDCDSTAWVLQAAAATTQWRPSAIRRAVQYVRRHWRAGQQGFATYAPEDHIDAYVGVQPELTSGWLNAHTCVSAVAVQALLRHGIRGTPLSTAVEGLQERQTPDGVWESYWWPGFAYATYQVLRALTMAEALSPQSWSRARRAIGARQNPDGGWSDEAGLPSYPCATAMAMLALLLHPDQSTVAWVEAGGEFLLQTMADGVWAAVPILRIPAPTTHVPVGSQSWISDAAGTNTIVSDVRQVFSTAAALWALSVTRDVLSPVMA